MTVEAHVKTFCEKFRRVREEVAKVIVGQEAVVEGVLTAMLAGGHVLLEGVPGLGKTMLVRSLAEALHLNFSRIQFTPDLMPADIVGTNLVMESDTGERYFEFQKGPIFANVILADEINRATPKTQSALLEAMQEHSVTVSKRTYQLELPFFVLATQNPIEMEGTYPLPEAQLDRFLFKLRVTYPDAAEMHEILDRTTAGAEPRAKPVLDAGEILSMRDLALEVPIARHVQALAVNIVLATHPEDGGLPFDIPEMTRRYVRYGASPRAAQALVVAGKIRALLAGRYAVSSGDIRHFARPALRHRIILNFEGEAEGVDPDHLIDQIVAAVPEPEL
ncbi:MAG TPA: MoxR family ATPase [Planctomycetota bacterium]|nr:MoxR family ATPase [Planctomycetota bacterium]